VLTIKNSPQRIEMTNETLKGVSLREFARRDGCDEKMVRKARDSGYLRVFDDGSIDPAFVGTGWRAGNRKNAESVRTGADISWTEDAGSEITSAHGAPHSLAEAERIKENYLALLRRLEFEEKSNQVVATDDVGAIVTAEYAILRNRLSRIPTDAAQRLANLCSAEEVEAYLNTEICKALQELALP
jgi:hypothetical protein